jgi:hypothetical protein
MPFQNYLSKWLELSDAQALTINGGRDSAPADSQIDWDNKCDAQSEGNFKVEGSQGNATVLVCEVTKMKANGELVYKWVP